MGVYVREQRGRLYLDYRINGRRHWESLHLTITKDANHNREARRLAEMIRSRKELQITSGAHGLLDPVEAKRSLFSYAENFADKQDAKNPLPKSLRYLREHAGALKIGAVTERWVEGYRDFLLSQESIGKATAGKYFLSAPSRYRRDPATLDGLRTSSQLSFV